jgi:hypothetical protein
MPTPALRISIWDLADSEQRRSMATSGYEMCSQQHKEWTGALKVDVSMVVGSNPEMGVGCPQSFSNHAPQGIAFRFFVTWRRVRTDMSSSWTDHAVAWPGIPS